RRRQGVPVVLGNVHVAGLAPAFLPPRLHGAVDLARRRFPLCADAREPTLLTRQIRRIFGVLCRGLGCAWTRRPAYITHVFSTPIASTSVPDDYRQTRLESCARPGTTTDNLLN